MSVEQKPWPVIRRETELDLLRRATRDDRSQVRLLSYHGEPFDQALLLVVTPYLAYRNPLPESLEGLVAASRAPLRDEDVEVRENPLIAVELPADFPDEAPAWHMLTPDVANPGILHHQVCFSLGWRSSFTILEVVTEQLIPLLRCQPGSWDARHPLNPSCADWAPVQKTFALPLGGSQPQARARPRIRRIG